MPRNGSGVYSLPQPPFVAGTTISSAAVNSNFSDIATALTGSLPTNGSLGMVGQLKLADGSSVSPSITWGNENNTGFFRQGAGVIGVDILGTQIGTFTAGGLVMPVQSGVPVGSMIDFASATVPKFWLQCFGQAVSRTTFALLFTAIGTTYGAGDGATTFNLPDARGTFFAGADNLGGTAAGRLTTTFFGNPDAIGGRGGQQFQQLGLGNMAPYTPSGTVFNGGISSSTFNATVGGTSQSTFNPPGFSAPLSAATIDVSSSQGASAFGGNFNGGGSAAFGIVPPGMMTNKIIYAGA